MSIQTAVSGNALRSMEAAFFSEESEGTNPENMGDSGTGRATTTQQDLARFWQALHDGDVNRRRFAAARWRQGGGDSAARALLPKNETEHHRVEAKKTQPTSRIAGEPSKHWFYCQFRR